MTEDIGETLLHILQFPESVLTSQRIHFFQLSVEVRYPLASLPRF